MLDSEQAMTTFLQLHRDRAGDRARADHGRQLEVVGARGGPQVRPGQGDRQLDQPQGRRRGLPAEGADRPPLRRRRRRDGVRRDRARRTRSTRKVQICQRAYKLLTEKVGFDPLGHHLRPEHPRDRDRHRGAQRLRGQLHRGDDDHQGDLPRREDQRRRQQPVVLVPRQRRRPRGDALGVPLSRDQGRPRHGDRQRRPARRLRGHPEGPARARRGRASSTAGRTRPSGWSSSPRRSRATGTKRETGPRVARRARRGSGCRTRSSTASSTSSRRTSRRRGRSTRGRSTSSKGR